MRQLSWGEPLGSDYAPPDAAAQIHNSLQGVWWLPEFLPHRYYDRTSNRTRWRIPLGARRQIPDNSLIHQSVIDRMNSVPDYCPPNLPPKGKYQVEPWNKFPVAFAVAPKIIVKA